jgi:hypothetical protein
MPPGLLSRLKRGYRVVHGWNIAAGMPLSVAQIGLNDQKPMHHHISDPRDLNTPEIFTG